MFSTLLLAACQGRWFVPLAPDEIFRHVIAACLCLTADIAELTSNLLVLKLIHRDAGAELSC